jgi:opacity protein-like surface antigen
MLKKYLLAGAAIAMVTVAHAVPRTMFMNGLSGGINAGYQANKAPEAKYSEYNTPTAGAHIDYNRIVSSGIFLGSGLEVNYAFNKGRLIQPDVFNGSDIRTLRRTATGVLTLRGGMISGRAAYEINGSLIVTKWKSQGKDATTKFLNRIRPGFAPGAAITVALDETKKMSVGVAYRYEIYSKGSRADNPLPRYNAHVALVKLSYHL